MAPEMFDNHYNGAEIDIFALGVCLFMMVSGNPPFAKADINEDSLYKKLVYWDTNEIFWEIHSNK